MNILISKTWRKGQPAARSVAALAVVAATVSAGAPLAGQGIPPAATVDSRPGAATAAQEPPFLSLEDAVAEALEANLDLEAARARTRAARAGADAASAFLWPGVAADAGWVRTDDPVAAFGTKLRQARFEAADFDVAALNAPAPVSDWSAGVGTEWRILDPTAWSRRKGADAGARASEWGLERRREATVFQTRVLYVQAVLADARLRAAEAAERAAEGTHDLFRRRAAEGVLTDADVLQAEAERASARARRIGAEEDVADARARLGLFLGRDPSEAAPVPADTALLAGTVLDTGESGRARATGAEGGEPVAARADLRAMESKMEAARAGVRATRRGFLPAVEAFGAISSHAPEIADGREAYWTAGVRLEWPLFTGFARRAALERSRAEARAVEVEYDHALREARVEVAEAERRVVAARGGVEASLAALEAATEAHRLVRRRFEEGLATPVDLLQAEARRTAMRVEAVDAAGRYRIAAARLDFMTTTEKGALER